jgi:hypothetical protein
MGKAMPNTREDY